MIKQASWIILLVSYMLITIGMQKVSAQEPLQNNHSLERSTIIKKTQNKLNIEILQGKAVGKTKRSAFESVNVSLPSENSEAEDTIGQLEVSHNLGNLIKPKWEYRWSLNPNMEAVNPAAEIIKGIGNGKIKIRVKVDTKQGVGIKLVIRVLAEKSPNAQIFLPIPTAYDDGTNWIGRTHQATHPSVIQFENNWNGYKYWMGFTPYPYRNNRKENPSIVASHDGMNWEVPKTISNPLVPINIEKAYNSDTHLVYNHTTNEVELWYRLVQRITHRETLYRIKTTDALNWTKPEAMVSASSHDFLQYISPSIIYENGKYKMWFQREWKVHYAESLDGRDWSKAIKINSAGKNIHTWHPSVVKFNDIYYLLNNDNTNKIGKGGVIKYSTSTDGINFTEQKLILRNTNDGESYDSRGVYRASMARGEHGVYLYYGLISETHQWTIGLSIGPNLDSLVGLDKETFSAYSRENLSKKSSTNSN